MTTAIRVGRLLDVESGAVGVDRVLHVGDDGRVSGLGGSGTNRPRLVAGSTA